MDNAMDRYLGQMLDNRYELLEIIGYGGMAVVYKALCHVLGRHVAVKILKDEFASDVEFREHFKAESRAVAMLSHPNIVAVYDFSKSPDSQYIVMELLEGITLKQYMQKKGALSWKESLHFATQTAKALSHAHGKGIVHRDIKPQNIMVGKDGGIKVADFGIAHLQNETDPDSCETMGSIHYISPEQTRGDPADARSDIYSLGVVMYEMLTGKLPYEGESVEEVAIQHYGSSLVLPGDINPDIPMRLEQITLRAMTSDINARYQSADELLEDLEDFRKQQFSGEAVDEEPIDVTEYGSGDLPGVQPISRAGELSKEDYARRKVRSRKVSTFFGIALVMIFLIAVVVFLWNYLIAPIFNPERVAVSSFVGEQVEDVTNSDTFKDLYRFKVVLVQNNEYTEGTIISQNPEAGRSIAPTNGKIEVVLTVSTGAILEQVPNVVNMEYRQATLQLEKLGFVVRTETVASDSITQDYVVSTDPAAGEKITTGSTIYIYISGGPVIDEIEMPYLIGKTRDQAIVLITEKGLSLGPVSESPSSSAAGTVIWQSVNSGEKVTKDTIIYITVSNGEAVQASPSPSPSPPAESDTPPPETAPPPETTLPVDPVSGETGG